MQKAVKKFINLSIIIAVAFVLVGLFFILFPQTSLDVLRWTIAIFFLDAGAALLANALTSKRAPFFGGTVLGTLLFIVGILFAVNPGVMDVFPIILGSWFIVSSVSTLRYASSLESTASIVAVGAAIVSIVAGVVLIINPWSGTIAMTVFAGIMMLIHAVASLVDLLTLKRNFDDLSGRFNKLIEGEVVEKKKETKKGTKKEAEKGTEK